MHKNIRVLFKTFPRFAQATFILEIEKHLSECKSIIDVGCGNNSPLKLFDGKYTTLGIDGYKPAIDESKRASIHDKYVVGDIRRLDKFVGIKSYDAAIALDVIEHLKKDDGYIMLKNMERAARKKVILVTPNGFVPQFNKDNGLQAHLSGWTVEDFEALGYKVEGIYGTKLCNVFRNDEAELRWRPQVLWKLVWGILVEITHFGFTKRHPKYSIALLAVKDLQRSS